MRRFQNHSDCCIATLSDCAFTLRQENVIPVQSSAHPSLQSLEFVLDLLALFEVLPVSDSARPFFLFEMVQVGGGVIPIRPAPQP